MNSQVIYICTDHRFPLKRLDSLISHFQTLNPSLPYLSRFYIKSRIHIMYVTDLDLQHFTICYHLPLLMKELNAKVVIIDSISCNFSCETFHGTDRMQMMYDMSRSLKTLASQENAVILLTNQVVDEFQEPHSALLNISMNRGIQDCLKVDTFIIPKKKKASLGLTWSYFVNSRLYIKRISDLKRKCTIEMSPIVQVLKCLEFIIGENGIQCVKSS